MLYIYVGWYYIIMVRNSIDFVWRDGVYESVYMGICLYICEYVDIHLRVRMYIRVNIYSKRHIFFLNVLNLCALTYTQYVNEQIYTDTVYTHIISFCTYYMFHSYL